MKGKKGMLLRDVVIALVFGMGVMALMTFVIGGMASNYDRTDLVSESFNQNYNKLTNLVTPINKAYNSTTTTSSLSFLGQFDIVINSFFAVVGLVVDSVGLYSSMTSSAIEGASGIYLDPTVLTVLFGFLITGLMIMVTFIIISAVTRGRV